MREFKFRAWNITPYFDDESERGQMVYFNLDQVQVIENLSLKNKIMQFTGLKDINGNDIFEGDIIEGGYSNPLTQKFVSRRYVVEYTNAYFMGKLIGHSPYGDTWLHFINGYVVGNVFENLELVEV